jgi:hypothetical protein
MMSYKKFTSYIWVSMVILVHMTYNVRFLTNDGPLSRTHESYVSAAEFSSPFYLFTTTAAAAATVITAATILFL